MSMRIEEEYEDYTYSSDDGGDGEDDMIEEDAASSASAGTDTMQWDDDSEDESGESNNSATRNKENPNAAPLYRDSLVYTKCKSGIQMMKADEIRREMQQRLEDVTEALGVPSAAASLLLQNFKWSKEALLEAYMIDSDKVLRQAGVYHRCGNAVAAAKSDKICRICYDDVSTNPPMLSMSCGHAFCHDCWYQFCVTAISEGPGVLLRKTCPQTRCPEVLTEEEFRTVLGVDNALFLKYQNFRLRSFIESKARMRWCPGPGCDRVAYAMTASAMEAAGNVAHCDTCCTSFCLLCGDEPHAPATCRHLVLWAEKCSNESETAHWIIANTKECPKCKVRIEKNQGCHHMTCRHCRYEFCWLCMADWSKHGYNFTCNKFEATTDADKARALLERYLHYYQRYHGHAEGEKVAQKHLREAEEKMDSPQGISDNANWNDMQLLMRANKQLVNCRRVLKFTYVFGYYLDSPDQLAQRNRFESYQEVLERFTENLSGMSEKPLEEIDRKEIVNQTGVVDQFIKNVLNYVDDGMEDV